MAMIVSNDYIVITLLVFILFGILFLVISSYIFLFKKETKNKLRRQISPSEEKVNSSTIFEDSNKFIDAISITAIDFNKDKEDTFFQNSKANNIVETFLKLFPSISLVCFQRAL